MKSLIIAFSMYSKLPMPQLEWKKENMRYVMCFFPAVGIVIGALLWLAYLLCDMLCMGFIFKAIVLTVIPVFISGGIHMDGFLDTVDALSSNGDREKKLSILKDSNSGAFAICFGIIYFLLSFAVWTEISESAVPYVFIVFVVSRTLSGLSVTVFKTANNSGLARMFQDTAHRRVCTVVLIIQLIIEFLLLGYFFPMGSIFCGAFAVITFFYHYYVCHVHFGGITGDLAGYFLQICELVCVFSFIIAGRM